MTDAATPPPTDRLKNTLEEIRASAAARKQKGLAGMVQEAILGFLNVLMALLADFRAGKLVPLAPGPRGEQAGESDVMREARIADRSGDASTGAPGKASAVAASDVNAAARTSSPPMEPVLGSGSRRGEGANGEGGAKTRGSSRTRMDAGSSRPSADAHPSTRFAFAMAEEEGDPALLRVRAFRISRPSACAAGGCIQATGNHF